MIEQRHKLKKLLEKMDSIIKEFRSRIDKEHLPGLNDAVELCDLADQVEDLVSEMWHDDALDYVKNLPPVERKTEDNDLIMKFGIPEGDEWDVIERVMSELEEAIEGNDIKRTGVIECPFCAGRLFYCKPYYLKGFFMECKTEGCLNHPE